MQRLSYISTPRCRPLRYCSIVDITRTQAIERPDQEILIHKRLNGERLAITNETLELKSASLAKYLYSIGIRRNQYVSIVGPNTIEWVIGELAILKTGAVSVHLSIGASDASDAMDIIKSTNCRYILMGPGVDKVMKTSLHTLQRRINEWNEINQNKKIKSFLLRYCDGLESIPCLEDILKSTIGLELPIVYPEDTAIIFATSGSTGQPKLVQISHFAFVNLPGVIFGNKFIYNDRPFAWLGGSPILWLALKVPRLFTDSNQIFKKDYAEYVWKSIKEEQCKYAVLLPFLISDMCEYKARNPDDVYQLKAIITGGEMIGDSCKKALGIVCSEVRIGYGSTEIILGSGKTILPDTDYLGGDVGRSEPGTEIKITNQNGDVTLWGIQGEICVRSNNICQGYLNAPEWNKDLFMEGGWIRTGDIGKLSDEGNLIILGKLKTVISRGTRTLLPAMIEDVIRGIPGLKEVAVIPVPDKRLHEEVCVCYISDIDENKMKPLSSDLFLGSEAADGLGDSPTYFVKLDTFPISINGKVDKKELQRIAIPYLGLA